MCYIQKHCFLERHQSMPKLENPACSAESLDGARSRLPGRLRAPCTFQVADQDGRWRVFRDEVFWGCFHSHGDAVRAACFGARAAEQRGRSARVLAPPHNQLMPHYEAHFGI